MNILEKGEDYKNLKRLLDYIDGQEASDELTRELETAVRTIKNNEKWRAEYMTLEMRYRELLEQGITNTISILKRNGFSDDKIAEELSVGFDISIDEAKIYVLNS